MTLCQPFLTYEFVLTRFICRIELGEAEIA